MVIEARDAVQRILPELHEHQRREQELQRQREAEYARFQREQEERRKSEAAKESHKQLLELMNQYAVAQQIRSFLEALTTYSAQLPQGQREPFEARLQQARTFLGDLRPEVIFARWEAPEAILKRMPRY